jgi:hypothetical protein
MYLTANGLIIIKKKEIQGNYRNFKKDNIKEWVLNFQYDIVSRIFQTDAIKIIKLTIRPIGHHHPRSSSLPHVDTGPTVSSIFGTLPENNFLAECQALSAIRSGSLQW